MDIIMGMEINACIHAPVGGECEVELCKERKSPKVKVETQLFSFVFGIGKQAPAFISMDVIVDCLF